MALRSVGLLAHHYRGTVAVAGIRRVAQTFRFQIIVSAIIQPSDWASAEDPVAYITAQYLAALESIVLSDPTQYLWSHARWGEETARRLAETPEPAGSGGSTAPVTKKR